MTSIASNYDCKPIILQKREPQKKDDIILYSFADDTQKSIATPMMAAKISPAETLAWLGVFDAAAALVQKYGPGVIDFIRDISAPKVQPTDTDCAYIAEDVPEEKIPFDEVA